MPERSLIVATRNEGKIMEFKKLVSGFDCDGEITRAPVGKNGFGYDPIFYYRPLNKTFAQILPEEKNEISHRGRAMAALRRDFERVMMWLHSYGAQR